MAKRKKTFKKPVAEGGFKAKAFEMLFPGSAQVNSYTTAGVEIPATASGYFDSGFGGVITDPVNHVFSMATDEDKLIHQLPTERVGKYPFLEAMAEDPTIDSAVKMHIANALSADPETGEILRIESVTDADNPIVEELRNTFQDQFNRCCQEWAFTPALLGTNYVRIYGEQGKGVTHIRNDFYTHPRFIQEYEQAGRLSGFSCAYQAADAASIMLEPWKFVAFKIPYWRRSQDIEPVRVNGDPVDLARDDYENESIVETQNYGSSMIETAYSPWFDLQEAILSLNMSRKNAARLERLIGVNTGKLDPQKAAKYYNTIAGQIQKSSKEMAKRSLRTGFVQTVLNHIIPVFGDSKGRLDINTIQGSPDIQGLEDVNFHVKRLGSALGIDPGLLGFGEMMSGGLGDGGFFRISVLAAIKSQMLRRAMKTGFERIFEIHVAYKYGKVFLPTERPWRLVFNSVSTAIEREHQENMEGRANLATSIAGLLSLVDPEFAGVQKRDFENYLFTDIMRMDEDKFTKIFPEALAKKAAEADAALAAGDSGGGAFESALSDIEGQIANNGKLREQVFNIITEFYESA